MIVSIVSSAPVLLTLAALGWGGNTIAARFAVGEMSPMTLVAVRWALVAAILVSIYPAQIAAAIRTYRDRRVWLLSMGAGLCGFNILFYIAAHDTSAINLGLIQSTIPAIIMLMGLIAFRTPVTLVQLLGLVITIAGAVTVISAGTLETILTLSFNRGDLLMVVGCCCYAFYALGLSRRPPLDSMVMMGLLAIASVVVSTPFAIAEWINGQMQLPGLFGWVLLAYIVVMPSLLSQVWFMIGVDRIGSGKAGMYTNLVPVFSAMLGVTLLNEALGFYHFVSLALVFGGLYVAQRR